jgi:carboxypeptidase Q
MFLPSALMRLFVASLAILAYSLDNIAQVRDRVDTAVVSKLRKNELKNSEVMEVLKMITDVHGPRLTNSPGYKKAADYASTKLSSWGIENVHYDVWDETFGRGWFVKRFSLEVTTPSFIPLIAWPKAWTPGVKGNVKAEAIYLDVTKEEDISKYKGKLKGKIVLFSLPVPVKPGYTPEATRLSDSALLVLANAPVSEAYTGRRYAPPSEPQRLAYLKWDLCQKEGALAVLEASLGSRSKDGTVMVSSATVPYPADFPYAKRHDAFDAQAPQILPQIVVAAEHYNRMIRQLQEGIPVTLNLTLETQFTPEERGFNIIGEIPGTDRSDEVVMIGAHFDSWHSGTGTTDNGVGVAVMMEAMRLIKSLGLQPRRTIRIALWGGEEQGLLGSKSYVRRILGERYDRAYPYDSIRMRPAAEKFSVYFNMDHGNGKYRGIYAQGNEKASAIFKSWLSPFYREGTYTVTLKNTSGTDHLSFDAIGLPAFQFIQDPIEYGSRTYHTNMDVFDKAVEADLRHNAIVTALFAWMAANRDEKIPRR